MWFCKFSNDGTKLATGSKDTTVIIWQVDPVSVEEFPNEHTHTSLLKIRLQKCSRQVCLGFILKYLSYSLTFPLNPSWSYFMHPPEPFEAPVPSQIMRRSLRRETHHLCEGGRRRRCRSVCFFHLNCCFRLMEDIFRFLSEFYGPGKMRRRGKTAVKQISRRSYTFQV